VASPEFHLLAEGSHIHRLVAFNAANVIVGWSKTVFDCFAFRENEFVVFKPAISAGGGWLRFVYALIDRDALGAKAVEEIVGLGIIVRRECFGSGLTFDRLWRT
jgi:hypothetical protein